MAPDPINVKHQPQPAAAGQGVRARETWAEQVARQAREAEAERERLRTAAEFASFHAACDKFGETTPSHLDEESPRWLIENVLVQGQPAFIAGPEKSLKSSIALLMSLALASGWPFLKKFEVPNECKVALFNGEMGKQALASKANLMWKPPEFWYDFTGLDDWWFYYDTLPVLSDPTDLRLLRDLLKLRKIDVVFIDPLYLCLFGGARSPGQVSNRHAMGPLLKTIADTCLRAGATPVFVDHTRRHTRRQVLSLDDLAYSGPAEFARQWILVNHRRPYDAATGTSRLSLNIGGSAGQGGVWELDVCEGTLAADADGRKWEVLRFERAGAAKKSEVNADDVKVLSALTALAGESPKAPGYEQVRKAAELTTRRMEAAVARLEKAGKVGRADTTVPFGRGREKKAKGLFLRDDTEV